MLPPRRGSGAQLVAERLTRSFGDRIAVDDVSLSVGAGEIVALLGPNGAGKTTTMRMLAGLILPGGGRIAINGVEVTRATAGQARHAIGLLTEAPGLWERLPVRLNLLTYAKLQGVRGPAARVETLLRRLHLADRADDTAGTLSKGLKQRVAIARALLHEPQVVLLDEPTSGLDPASARQMRDLIAELRSEGRAILVSTHNLGEAEELSDRIAILRTRLLACDSAAALRNAAGVSRVIVEVQGSREPLDIPIKDLSEVPAIVARLVAEGRGIIRVTPDQRSLEQVYLDLVGAEP
ncbi:MAG TPA: ABC transporter ATP-binding protein [Vicinamibacterales bacterium]|nr:ABC transporter ATP-binding protein [Vicinamibacterales bacterium]